MSVAGEYDFYSELAAQNYAMLPGFEARQVKAGKQIFETLLPYLQKGALEVIVDLGCGSGEVLVDLVRRLSQRQMDFGDEKTILLIGFDCSKDLICKADDLLAKVRLATNVRCRFELCDIDRKPLFQQLDAILKREGGRSVTGTAERMAVLCLGHTIFHFLYIDTMFQVLKTNAPNRPQLFIVDIYHSWDATVEELRASDVGIVNEPKSFTRDMYGNNLLNVLFTRKSAESPGIVERGLIQARNIELNEEPVILTRQLARTSRELAASFAEARYLLIEKAASHSGYGEVNRFIFLRSMRAFSLPALFLDTKAVPSLKVISENHSHSAQASPLHILAQWMNDAGFIEPRIAGRSWDSGGFDFAVVEIAPWYATPMGLASLELELLICARAPTSEADGDPVLPESGQGRKNLGFDRNDLHDALESYRDTLFRAQNLHIGPFLHPSFAGYHEKNEWGRGYFGYLDGQPAGSEFTEGKERERFEKWRIELDEIQDKRAPDLSEPDELPNLSHILGLIEKSSAEDLVLLMETLSDKMSSYDARLRMDYDRSDAATFAAIEPRLVSRDLEMVHALLHDRLRTNLKLCQPAMKTVLLGIPLRILVEMFPNNYTGLPVSYKGGIWIFAGTSGEFGPRQHTLIGDLARLSVLLANTAIEAKAAETRETTITGKYNKLCNDKALAKARYRWHIGHDTIKRHDIYNLVDRHNTKDHDESARPPEMDGKVRGVATDIIEGCIGQRLALDFYSSLVFLKGLYRGYRWLSLFVIKRVLLLRQDIEIDCGVGDRCEGFIECNDDGFSNGGILLRAIHMLLMSNPTKNTVRKTAVRLHGEEARGAKWELIFEFEYVNQDERASAMAALWLSLEKRDRLDGQQGNTACILLRWATATNENRSEDADAELIGDRNLRLSFRFPYFGAV